MILELDLPTEVAVNILNLAAHFKCTPSQIVHTYTKLVAFPSETVRIEAQLNSKVANVK